MNVRFKSNQETLTATLHGDSSLGVVLCPPHPLFGGSRNDTRIVRVARQLAATGISALAMDYGSYGKGLTEVQNVLDAVSFMQKRVDSLGLLGYSFGAVVGATAAGQIEVNGFAAMSILKKVNGLNTRLDFGCPKLFVHGKRDIVASFIEFQDLYRMASEKKKKLILDTDHFYMDNYPATLNLACHSISNFFKDVLNSSSPISKEHASHSS